MGKRARWVDVVRERQAAWLAERGVAVDGAGYALEVDANLFCLSAAARDEFQRGSGKELPTDGTPGKLSAPWSSSALAANVFDYWRARDMEGLRTALRLSWLPTQLRLEARFLTGFSHLAPANLDVVLEEHNGERLAIESKLCEPFEGGPNGTRKDNFAETYVAADRERDWLGLAHLRALAIEVKQGNREFFRLDVPQLTKHCLALRRDGRPFELLLLWYSPPTQFVEAAQMQREIEQFADVALRDGVRFRALTYQDVFALLRTATPEHTEYLAYLSSRYFPTTNWGGGIDELG